MSVGVLMTGMGEDGAEGLGAIKAAGGVTVAQSEESCVVPGMPRAAILKGYANRVVSLEVLGQHLITYFGGERAAEKASERAARQEKFDRAEKNERNEKFEKNEKGEKIPASNNRS